MRFGRAPVRAARRDANEAEIVALLVAWGAAVQQLDPPLPDLLVSYRGILYLLEVKDHDAGKATRSAKRRNHDEAMPPSLTPQQVVWWRAWRATGGKDPVLVMTAREALLAIGAELAETAAPR